ncbi:MAG: hypothetical protein ACR2Q4_22390 [Geminicoccaceae bacterium]
MLNQATQLNQATKTKLVFLLASALALSVAAGSMARTSEDADSIAPAHCLIEQHQPIVVRV